jgi:hypothetical protein
VIRDWSFVIGESQDTPMGSLLPITNHQSPITAPQGATP